MSKLTIVLSGRKQAGKDSTCNYIAAKFLNRRLNANYRVNANGKLTLLGGLVDGLYAESHGVKVFSFADPLKRFCIDVLGAPEEACYGTDEQKNAKIPHLLWENLPAEMRLIDKDAFASIFGVIGRSNIRSGTMSGRDLMQVIGTDFARKLYNDCWARGTYATIAREGFALSLVCDGRFPNEITIGSEVNAKTLRLTRNPHNDTHKSETALDYFPHSGYSHVLDNREMTLEEQCAALDPVIDKWFDEAGIR